MKRILPCLLLAVSISLHAAPPSPQSVEKLATLAKVEKIHDAMLAQLQQSVDAYVKQALRGQALTPADQAVLDAFHPQMLSMVDEQLSGPKIKAMFEEVYSELFTQEEVDGLISFYGTPVGQVFADKQPLISGKVGALIGQRAGQMGMRLQMAMYSAAQKIAKAHAPPPPVVKPAPAAAAKPPAPGVATPVPAAATPKGN